MVAIENDGFIYFIRKGVYDLNVFTHVSHFHLSFQWVERCKKVELLNFNGF